MQKDWGTAMPFVKQTLGDLRKTVKNSATVLGFVGLPYTLATYLIEGGTSKEYLEIKKMMWNEPKLLHTMLEKLAANIGEYANHQIECGAQVIQVFDSWAGSLSPEDYDLFALPYQKMVVKAIKDKNPNTPVIIYIAKSGALIERMARSSPFPLPPGARRPSFSLSSCRALPAWQRHARPSPPWRYAARARVCVLVELTRHAHTARG